MGLSLGESSILKSLTRLSQEMVSLKAPQRYLVGQTKGYKSNELRIDSQIAFERQGFVWREIYCELRFTGDKANKTAFPTLHFQLYDSTGQPISAQAGWADQQLTFGGYGIRGGDALNEYRFLVFFYVVRQGSPDAFYGNFWAVANDSGNLSLAERFVSN